MTEKHSILGGQDARFDPLSLQDPDIAKYLVIMEKSL